MSGASRGKSVVCGVLAASTGITVIEGHADAEKIETCDGLAPSWM
ncbi:hypothetical protein [Bifidobacterium crudilactis]